MTPSPSAEIEKTLMSLIRAKDENIVEKILEDKFFADAIILQEEVMGALNKKKK